MAVKMAVVKNLVAVKGLQVAVNFGEGDSEGLPRSGNTAAIVDSTGSGVSVTVSVTQCGKMIARVSCELVN